jgi:endo-1,4-beta-D-glucanase Y
MQIRNSRGAVVIKLKNKKNSHKNQKQQYMRLFIHRIILCSICALPYLAFSNDLLFPIANTYPYGIKPQSVNQEQMNQDCLDAFNDFINNSVTSQGCPPEAEYRVHIGQSAAFAGTSNYDTFSEGIGWGMIFTVIMDNGHNNTRKYFDGFNNYRKSYLNSSGLMKWLIDSSGVAKSSGIAVEADENIAHALMIAHYKWGSDSINYKQEAIEIMNALVQYCVQAPEMFMKPGDTWGGYNLVHPNNFDVCYYNDWYQFTGDSTWSMVKNESYNILNKIYSQYPTGYLPHWCDYNGNATSGLDAYFSDYTYEWDALQTSIKISLDFLVNGDHTDTLAFKIPNRLSEMLKDSTMNNINNMATEYSLNGKVLTATTGNSAFIGAAGVASMVSSDHQVWCDHIYTTLRNKSTGGTWAYYKDIIRLFSLIIMSGNFPVIVFNQ